MQLYKRLELDFEHADSRGKLVQVLHQGFQQINILFSNKDALRGGHYHKKRTEAFYIIKGSVKTSFFHEDFKEECVFKENEAFIVPAEIIHSMYFPENCIMLQMYDEPVENPDGSMDIFQA